MKITFVLPRASLAGGVRVVAIHARKLLERGHDVTVISQGTPPRSPARRLSDLIRGRHRPGPRDTTLLLDFLGDRHVVINEPYPFDPDRIPDADAIIATWWTTAYAVSALPPSKGRHFYFIQHHEVHPEQPWHLSRGSYFLPMRKITISRWLVETMAELYGDRQVGMVENSVDMAQFHAPARAKNAVPTVGLMYSRNPFKGVDVSLKAIDLARRRVPDLRVVAFGTGPLDPALPLPPGSDYHRNPPQDRLREIYASCDLWLCGSRSEGFGLPIIESMACRTPVVSTRTGCASDVIGDGENGYVVGIDDPEAMADRIVRVLSLDDNAWQAMSQAAFRQAQGYTWDDAAARLERLLVDGLAD